MLYLAAHIFLRCILSNYSGINPEKLDFAHNAFGKPSLHSETKLRFNLSHTSGMIVCGISYGLDVGVDVENHTRSIDMHSILKSSYSSNETENVLRQNSNLQQRLFFSYWTLKEAYVKGVGEGLSIPLKECEFMKQKGQGWMLIKRELHRSEKTKWKFYSSTLGTEWVVSVAVDSGLFSANQALIVRMTDSNSRESRRWSSTTFEGSI
jgi:4'-phosphopantetheinyl transferase